MKRLLLVGAGKGGSLLLDVLKESGQFYIAGVVDRNLRSSGIEKAENHNIPVFDDWRKAFRVLHPIDIVVEVTGDNILLSELRENVKEQNTTIVPSAIASMIFHLIEEKKKLLEKMIQHNTKLDTILNSTQDGMIAIDQKERITLLNRRAEQLSGLTKEDALGRKIHEVMPTSKLPRVLKTGKPEENRKQIVGNGRRIITTRIPMFNGRQRIGALAVFQDITDIVNMAEEVTNLKSIQQMLEAIIQSSDDAISVVDEDGFGLLINPAYTRLTGLKKQDVIGKPASTDISEGESMHMHVLQSGKAVRGAKMKVGPNGKDVIVNVAPINVDGAMKGSVAVIHDMSEIEALHSELERAKQIIRTLEAKYTFDDIIGESEELKTAIRQAKRSAVTPATILLQGESGTGKELFAHAIHNESNRKYNKFIRVNCAAISESLLESELFGYEDGAFSGAKRGGKKGLFEEANRGSIFLDEIGEITPQTQAKLLRVLQEKEIVRVGGTKVVPVDVRIIAATNADIQQKIREKSFREDLFYRLNRMPIFIPPLRYRKADIPRLCQHLLLKLNQDYGRSVGGLTEQALQTLTDYGWPGNVRELENILGRAMIHMHYSEKNIDRKHLPLLTDDAPKEKEVLPLPSEQKTLQEIIDAAEKQAIVEALRTNCGNKTQTAKQLGISIRNLYYKLDKYASETAD
nr:sigma-54-dependent Fis family transcriptional regulator [Evansella caseinilytica]